MIAFASDPDDQHPYPCITPSTNPLARMTEATADADGVQAAGAGGPGFSDRRATALEAYISLLHEGPGAEAVRSYLAPGAEPRYDTPDAQAEAELEAGQ